MTNLTSVKPKITHCAVGNLYSPIIRFLEHIANTFLSDYEKLNKESLDCLNYIKRFIKTLNSVLVFISAAKAQREIKHSLNAFEFVL